MNTLAKTFLLLALCAAPGLAKAQCACSGPTEGGTINYTIELPVNNFSTNIIKVPKFNPEDGHVTCVNVDYNFTLLSSIYVRNKESVPKNYRFMYNVNPSLTIGNASHTDTYIKYYPGMQTNINLAAYGDSADAQLFGPDTIALDQHSVFSQAINPALFMGTDSTEMIFEFSGGVNSILGGVNYEQVVSTESWGEFRVSISWCPNTLLNEDLKDFSAQKTVGGIKLNWSNTSENAQNQYIIQISKDGNTFVDLASLEAVPGNGLNHQYEYLIEGIQWNQVYVRIKMINPNAPTVYSPIRVVQSVAPKYSAVQVSPNPAKEQVSLSFSEPLNGQYKAELIGLSGQIVYQQALRFANQSNYLLKIPKLANGLYYLRISSVNQSETFVTKVYISN